MPPRQAPYQPASAIPESVVSGTAADCGGGPGQPVPETSPGTACRAAGTGTVSGTIGAMTAAPAYDNSVGIGYARVSTLWGSITGSGVAAWRGGIIPE